MPRNRILFSLAVLACARLATAQTLVVSAGALPANNVWTDGVAIADVDNDNDNDILFANGSVYGGTGAAGALAQALYLNNGSGVFSDGSAMLNVAAFNAKMVIAHDFDNDGLLDVMYSSGSTGSPPRYLRNLGFSGPTWLGYVDETATRIPALALRSFCVCAGDVDNDGDLDVAVNDGGTFGGIATQAHLLINDGTGVFTDVTAAQLPVDLFNCQDLTLVDLDGDYDLDIALNGKSTGGTNGRLYLNNGSGTFTLSTILNTVGSSMTYETDYGDIDGDNDFDAAVQSISGSPNPALEGWGRNDGTGTPFVETTFPGTNGDDDNEMALMDYDNDGDLDVFIASLGASEKVYRNTAAVFAKQTTVIQAQADATLDFGFGDLNGDHKYDMVTAQGEAPPFPDKVYLNSGAADTLPPKFLRTETPGAIGASGTVFRAQISDAIADDGVINATASICWATGGVGAAVGTAPGFDQGDALIRSVVPTTAGTTGVSVWWVAIDSSGNKSFKGPISIGVTPPSPWVDQGFGLAGTAGIPLLEGTGTLIGGCPAALNLSNAAPSALAVMFVSFTSTPVAFKGGTLAAFPFFLTLGLTTSPSGTIPLPFLWPTGLPSGFEMFVQYGISDAGGPVGVALSNCIKGTTP